MVNEEKAKGAAAASTSKFCSSSSATTSTALSAEAAEMIRRLRRYSYATFGTVREFADFDELSIVHQDNVALQLQPLLIRLRILGPDHPDTIYFLRYTNNR